MNKFKLFYAASSENTEAQTVETEDTSVQDSSTEQSNVEQTQDVKLFNQKQVDKILAKRLKETEAKYSDYEALKAENESLKAKTREVTKIAQTAEQQLKDTRKITSIENAAKEVNFPVDLASKLLEPSEFIVSEDGSITNAKELLTKLITLHPQLVRKSTPDTPVINSQDTQTEPKKFSLNPNTGSKFFNGGGLVHNQT